MGFKSELRRNFLGLGFAKLFSIFLGLIVSVVLARALGEDQFGQYVFIMALIPLVSIPVSGGVSQLLTREVAWFWRQKSWPLYKGVIRAAHFWILIVSILAIGSYWALRSFEGIIPTGGKWDLLPIALLLIPLGGLNAVRKGTIKGIGRPLLAELPGLLIQQGAFLAIVLAILWIQPLDASLVMSSQVASAVVALVIASVIFWRLQPSRVVAFPLYELRKWGTALIPLMMVAAVGVTNTQIAIVILGVTNTDGQVAAMRLAERGALLVGLPLVVANMVAAPHFATMYRSGDKSALQGIARKTAGYSFVMGVPIAFTLVFFGKNIIAIVFGSEYAEVSYAPLLILVAGQLANVFFGSVGYLLAMTGHEKDSLKGQIVAVFTNIVLCSFLAPVYGAVGAAIGSGLGVLVWNMLLSRYVNKRLGVRSSAI